MLSDFLIGFSYPWRALSTLIKRRYRRLVWPPIVITALTLAASFTYVVFNFHEWTDGILPWWLAWLDFILLPLFFLLVLLIFFFCFSRLANLIGAPFNAVLCQTLMRECPEDPLTVAASRQTWRNLLQILPREILKLLLFLLWITPLLALSVIPVLDILAKILIVYFGIYWCAFEYLDYPLSEAGLPIRRVRRRLLKRRALSFGFGAGQALLTLIPVLNLVAIATGVVAATRLCQEHPLDFCSDHASVILTDRETPA